MIARVWTRAVRTHHTLETPELLSEVPYRGGPPGTDTSIQTRR